MWQLWPHSRHSYSGPGLSPERRLSKKQAIAQHPIGSVTSIILMLLLLLLLIIIILFARRMTAEVCVIFFSFTLDQDRVQARLFQSQLTFPV